MPLELIDQPGGQVLLDQVGASCEQHIAAARGLLRLSPFQRTNPFVQSVSKPHRGQRGRPAKYPILG